MPHLDSLVANVAPGHTEMASEFMDLVHLIAQYEREDPNEAHQRDHTRVLQDISDELLRHQAQSKTAALVSSQQSLQAAREEQLRRFM
jgi:hypothetical protein